MTKRDKAQVETKYFTLQEARNALPKVKALMQIVQDARQEILRLRPEIWPVLRKAAGNGGSRQAGEIAQEFEKLEKGVKGIMNMGIFVKDVDSGLIDFLGKRDGREVFLCWKYGEDDIEYWHDVNAGFAGRRPIDSRVR